ncbi:hypothetical protein BJX70DRAFT_409609 [Aspergillus crustosus]
MDLLKQRLTFASLWEFEDIGVQELEAQLTQEIPLAQCHCEYLSEENVLVIKGQLTGYTAQIGAMMTTCIEKRKDGDLLDTVRIRMHDLPNTARDASFLAKSFGASSEIGLLALDDGSEEYIPHPNKQVTKFWVSSDGAPGYFSSHKHQAMFNEIAKGTGTEITIVDECKGLQVAGRSESDVNDALEKLSQIEKPLLRLNHPLTHNLMLGAGDPFTRYKLQSYASLNPLAARRVLAEPSSYPNAGLGQIFVTIAYTFGADLQGYVMAKGFREPPQCANQIGSSRIWNDFTFPEVGDRDEKNALELAAIKGSHSNPHVMPVTPKNHAFLSPERVQRVEEWVGDRSGMEATKADKLDCEKPADTVGKEVPGIKKRRPIQHTQSVAVPATKSVPPGHKSHSDDDKPNTLRKRWDMTYGPDLRSVQVAGAEQNAESSNPSSSESNQSNSSVLEHIPRPPSTKFDPTKYGAIKASAQPNKPTYGNLTRLTSRHTPVIRNKSPNKAPKKLVNKSPNKLATKAAGSPQGKPLGHKAPYRPSITPSAKPLNRATQLIDILRPNETTKANAHAYTFDAPCLVPGTPKRCSESPTQSDSVQDTSAAQATAFPDLAGLDFKETANSAGLTTSESLQYTPTCRTDLLDQETRLQRLVQEHHNLATSRLPTLHKPHLRPGDLGRMLEKQRVEDFERACKSDMEQPINEQESREYHRTMNQRTSNPGQKAKTKAAKRQATLEASWGMPKQNKAKPTSENLHGQSAVKKAEDQERRLDQIDDNLKQVFMALKPTLSAAESFPGNLGLELQFGLILIPVLPKTCSKYITSTLSLNDWSKIFQPQSGTTAPSTKFVNRMSVCGSEIDHIMDLKTSKSRMFAEEYSEYNLSYEFHCKAKGNELVIITLDEKGKHSIQKQNSVLGAVNLHCPNQIWDARVVMTSALEYRHGADRDLDETAQHIADHLHIPAEKHLVLYTSLPETSKVEVQKVYMKRWTRHRYLSQGSEAQSIFLQVQEVQELIPGFVTMDKQHVRARYSTPGDMIQRGNLWYELSLVSPAIEAILRANKQLEVGERVEDWRSIDLLGQDAALFPEQQSNSRPSPAAAGIGSAGLTRMLRLAMKMIEKMDGVGACNCGPLTTDTLRAATINSQVNSGLDFEDIESVKEVESVTARMQQDPLITATLQKQQFEKDYW